VEAALETFKVLEDINKKEAAKKKGEDHERVIQQRCGVHTGQCVAGVLGSTTLAYDIWGDDVTYAGLMESNGVPGKVQVSSTTYSLIKQHFKASPRELKIKGHGLVSAYLIDGFNEAEAS
jgi:class 3 adenylate cyclase